MSNNRALLVVVIAVITITTVMYIGTSVRTMMCDAHTQYTKATTYHTTTTTNKEQC